MAVYEPFCRPKPAGEQRQRRMTRMAVYEIRSLPAQSYKNPDWLERIGGWLMFAGLSSAVGVLFLYVEEARSFGAWSLAIGLACFFFAYLSHWRWKEKRAKEAAEGATERANALLDRSAKLVTDEMPRALDWAIGWLKHAEKEYAAHAYGPFWDGVEKAAHQLNFFNNGLQELARNTDEYYGLLKGREHNFPLICEGGNVLPDPRPVLQGLARVARMGQTNIDFAKIWEHRQTREVLIAGFRSLGEGMNNLAAAVQGSMAALEGSISSNLQQLAGEEIRSRQAYITASTRQTQLLEEQNRKLHRIEQDRKRL